MFVSPKLRVHDSMYPCVPVSDTVGCYGDMHVKEYLEMQFKDKEFRLR